ncbi:Pyridoxal phosphate phosphatase PHOSPHO2 [Orchesella cincta]|uniref:Pyridoxal phosphate phosphatase PHOSPHO2 n=1 Tax=Orchesella cincta TaxID=48709 RepID=A0A1D2MRY3_ORCCI|nr:Pyridoxal phosphate phosphatase PHOSPHO2 [Orchesella cincta]
MAKSGKLAKKSCCHCLCSCEDEEQVAYLYAFDFDHTIVDQNSDTAVMEIIHDPIPDNLQRMYDGTNWTEYMDQIFRFVADEGGTYDVIADKISLLKPTEGLFVKPFQGQLKTLPTKFTLGLSNSRKCVLGMIELLQRISESRNVHHHSKLVVISDANTFFIQTFLTSRRPPLIADAIITNQADKTDEGYLKLTPYEQQQACPLCPRNLCKGAALERYIELKGPFNKVYYTGDGGNDVCPAMKLTENDVVFVRKNFAMEKIIAHGNWKGQNIDIKAKIVYWDDAKTIEEEMDF